MYLAHFGITIFSIYLNNDNYYNNNNNSNKKRPSRIGAITKTIDKIKHDLNLF